MKLLLMLVFSCLLFPQDIVAQKILTEKDWLVVNSRKQRNKEEARVYIDSIREHVISGYSFSVLASLFSEDPGSAKQGGKLPTIIRGQMVPEFENVAYRLKVGEISEVFETKFGFHFIQLMAKEADVLLTRHILISYK